jgi:hypothetical protein
MVEFGNVVKFRFWKRDLKTAKQFCEENYNLEI